MTRPCTHVSLGNLLPLAGILQGADTEVGDGDSTTGSQGDQHEKSPQAAVQRQLQAVVLLKREGGNIHFTPGDVSGDGESRDYSKAIAKLQRPHFTQASLLPNFTVWTRVIDRGSLPESPGPGYSLGLMCSKLRILFH